MSSRIIVQLVGVLDTGVPRLACLRPTAWLHRRPGTTQLRSNNSRPSRGPKPREADDTKTSKGIGLLRLAPVERRFLCKAHLARFG